MSSPSSKAPGSLPSITALRKELDYGNSQLERCKAFYDDIRVFRKKFQTSSGKPGYKLYEWKDSKHQAWLKEMTEAYLERDGNGRLFWPDDRSAAFYNKWQYTRHAPRIKSLVRQLFFRLNQQQFRNEKYKGRGKTEPKAAERSGRTTDDPIDLDAVDTSPDMPLSPSSPTLATTERECTPDAAAKRPPPGPTQWDRTQSHDAYTFPSDPDLSHPATPTTKHKLSPSDRESGGRQAKRPKSDNVLVGTPRRTSRQTKPLQDPSHIRGDDCLRSISAAVDDTHSPTPEPTLKTPEPSRTTFPSTGFRPGSEAAEIVVDPSPVVPSRPERLQQDAASRSPTPRDKVVEPTKPRREESLSPRVPFAPMEAVRSTTEGRQSAETLDCPKPAVHSRPAVARPSISFIYCLVLSRYPVYSYKIWEPSQKLEDMTFEKFMWELTDELPIGVDVQGLDFTVEGPGLRAEQTIPRGDEPGFDFLRRRIKRVIRGQLQMRDASAGPLVFEMEIEPILANNPKRKQEADDEDFKI